MGVQWFESWSQSKQRLAPFFFPTACQFSMQLRAQMSSTQLAASFARVVNHQCDSRATATLDMWAVPEVDTKLLGLEGVVWPATGPRLAYTLVAARDLAADDELTYDYTTAPYYIYKPPALVRKCSDRGVMAGHRQGAHGKRLARAAASEAPSAPVHLKASASLGHSSSTLDDKTSNSRDEL